MKNIKYIIAIFLVINITNLYGQFPGNIGTDLVLWLMADAGVTGNSPVTAWDDQCTTNNNATAVNTPVLTSEAINFNPVITFTETNNDHFTLDDPTLLPTGNSGRTYLAVADPTAIGEQPVIGHGTNLARQRADVSHSDNELAARFHTTNDITSHTNTNPYISTMSIATGVNVNPGLKIYHNGAVQTDNYGSGANSLNTGITSAYIGRNQSNTAKFNGSIAEVIVYNRKLTNGEKQQAESYLALKYGITIDQTTATDYIASDGTTKMWDKDATNASTYNNDIAGIGRDDNSELGQVKSKSVNSDAIVTIEADGEGTNAAPVFSDIADLEFLTISNNNGSTSTASAEVPQVSMARLTREWLVQETGEVGNITVAFDLDEQTAISNTGIASEYNLLIDSDGDFSNAIVSAATASFVGNEITFTGVSEFSNGTYFTLVCTYKSPGGNLANLQLWLKADAGVTSSGGDVSAWADQAGSNDAVQGTTANQPDEVPNSINFNTALTFDGTNDWLGVTRNFEETDYTQFVIYQTNDTDGAITVVVDNPMNPTTSSFDRNLILNNGKISHRIWSEETITSSSVSNDDIAHIATVTVENGVGQTLDTDGIQVVSGTKDQSNFNSDGGMLIGYHNQNASRYGFQGEIAEIIWFNAVLSATDNQQVESYLALKWGITLDQTAATDYIASDGTTEMWDKDASNAGTYNNDIAGIGRDDNSELGQIKSKSVNSDAIVTVEADNEGTNAANAFVDIANLEFLTWGNDNGSTSTASTEVPQESMARLSREWLVQETGETGNLTIAFDLDGQTAIANTGTASEYKLLIDADGDFSNATISTATASFVGNEITFTGTNLNNGDYFTLARTDAAPGGNLADLKLWLKADGNITDPGTNVTSWIDETGNTGDFNLKLGDPDLQSDIYNFNPTVNFDGDDYFRLEAGGVKIMPAATVGEIFYMLESNGAHNTSDGFPGEFGGSQTLTNQYDYINSNIYDGFGTTVRKNWNPLTAPAGGPAVEVHDPHIYNVYSDAGDWTASFDGTVNYTNATNTVTFANTASNNTYLGASHNTAFIGNISEVILFDRKLGTTERNQVNSYMALKYGITLDQSTATDYIASDGTTEMWDKDAANASTYNNDIAGIGRDDNSELGQVKSKSVNSDAIVTVEADGEGTNAAPTFSDIADLEFLTIGNDDGSISAASSEVPQESMARLTREWLVQETGETGNLTIAFDLDDQTAIVNTGDASKYKLLIDTDGDFSNATVSTATVTFVGNEITFIGVNLNDGDYFTLAHTDESPGGNLANLKLWMKADVGVTTTGSDVSAWNDQSGNNYDATQGTASLQPDVTTDAINFNEAIDFDGVDDQLISTTADNLGMTGTTPFTVITVFQRDADNGNRQSLIANSANVGFTPFYYVTTSDVMAMGRSSFGEWAGAETYQVGGIGLTGMIRSSSLTYQHYARGAVDGAAYSESSSLVDVTMWIGNRSAANHQMNGKIAEMIIYNTDLSAGDLQEVNSYLALKYGVTLDQTTATDYIASDATTEMWDKDAANASTYNNDIAGIGRDDNSELGQVKSKSVNSDAIVTVEADNEGTNSANVFVDISDLEFLTWGNDNGSTSVASTETPQTDMIRLTREWLVQETGEVGNITVAFDLDEQTAISNTGIASEYNLLIDSDGNFSNATVSAATASFVGNEITFTGVSEFSNGTYFTLVCTYKSPGGNLANLQLWLKADAGTSTTTDGALLDTWSDQSSSGNNATNSLDNRPMFSTSRSINFNPVIEFATPDAGATNTNKEFLDISNVNIRSAYWVAVNDDFTENNKHILYGSDGGNNGSSFHGGDGGSVDYGGVPGSWQKDGGSAANSTQWTGGVDMFSVRANGNELVANIGGNQSIQPQRSWDGSIVEVVLYSSDNTNAQRNQIESYLALKYGITLNQIVAQDYIASDGTTEMWDKDAANASTYNNDIAGIGRDDNSELGQVKSKSVNSDAIVTIEADNEGTNAANVFVDIADLEFLTWGNDNGTATWTSTGAPGLYQILSRQWLCQENNGDIGTVTIEIDVADTDFNVPAFITGTAYFLVYDSDNDGSLSDETPVQLYDNGTNGDDTASDNIWTINNIDFDNGVKFTLATYYRRRVIITD